MMVKYFHSVSQLDLTGAEGAGESALATHVGVINGL